MKSLDRRAVWGARLVIVGLLVFAGLRPQAPAGAQPAQADPQIGPVGVLALDGTGNGWAWAAPKPQTFATSFLLRIENGVWRIALDSTSAPAVLPLNSRIDRIVLTAKGDEGWAIDSAGETNLLWHLQGGAWHIAKSSIPPTVSWFDLTMSADGSDGWLLGYDRGGETRLLRLRNGSWGYVAAPTTGKMYMLAISPDA